MIQFIFTITTQVLCNHCLYFFAQHSEAQQKIREEILIHSLRNTYGMIFTLLQSVSKQHFINLEDFDNKRWLTPEPIINLNLIMLYIPFSAGPKNCIGQHMKLIQTKIILSLTQYTCSTQIDFKICISVQPSNYMRLSKIKEINND